MPALGETYDPDRMSEIQFKIGTFSYGAFINEYFNKNNIEVSDEEHIALLAFWLCHYVSCTHSLQVAKKIVIMATQLHEGHSFCLSKLLLGNLYDSIGTGCQTMKTLAEGMTLNLDGPWWLFQLWIVSTFENKLQFHIQPIHHKAVNNRRI